MAKPDGGAAFPLQEQLQPAAGEYGNAWLSPGQTGMSLRDYFAAQALIGMQAHPASECPAHVARWAYQVADAMLAERAK